MSKHRMRWATTTDNGTPLIIEGVTAIVDDETGSASLDERAQEVIAEVLANDPIPSRAYVVPGIDLAEEVHRLIQQKHKAGIPVRSPLPRKKATEHGSSHPAEQEGTIYDAAIDAILTAVYSHLQFLSANLTGQNLGLVPLDDLRRGRLGQTLRRIGRIAAGIEQASSREFFDLDDYVHRFLDRPLATTGAETSFYEMARAAERNTMSADEWMSLGEAARELDLSPRELTGLLANFSVREFFDPKTGETFLYRQDFSDILDGTI